VCVFSRLMITHNRKRRKNRNELTSKWAIMIRQYFERSSVYVNTLPIFLFLLLLLPDVDKRENVCNVKMTNLHHHVRKRKRQKFTKLNWCMKQNDKTTLHVDVINILLPAMSMTLTSLLLLNTINLTYV